MEVIRTANGYAVRCFSGEKVSGHMPSVDVLFRSVAKNVTGNKVGIIMTGMGKDGAEGLLEMRRKGAYTIGQDKASCVVYGMPMVAYNIGAVAIQAACENIPSVLLNHLKKLS
jgi:two-component system chemotaxis response regulator CheB